MNKNYHSASLIAVVACGSIVVSRMLKRGESIPYVASVGLFFIGVSLSIMAQQRGSSELRIAGLVTIGVSLVAMIFT